MSAAALFQFYESVQGQFAARRIHDVLSKMIDCPQQDALLGIGYPLPFLPEEMPRGIWAAPGAQGIFTWPATGKKRGALVRDHLLPFADASVDAVLLAHSLEHVNSDKAFLRDVWRIMRNGAPLYVIVPNRLGLWAKSDVTPFGQGKPYSLHQVRSTLEDACFMPLMCRQALYGWPHHRNRRPSSFSRFFGFLCERFMGEGGGVHIIAAKKQLLAPTGLVQKEGFRLRKRAAVETPNTSL